MKIWIVAHFCDGSNEHSNNRFNYLYNLLIENNHDVKLITSDFSHREKKYRENTAGNESIILIHEPKYRRNISLKRFYSHHIFAINLRRYLQVIPKPDVVYCAVPSLDVGYVMSKYCKKNNIKLIIDIQDLWPEAFKMVFNIPLISNLLYFPMENKANYIYSSANKIIAVSDTYRNRGLRVNRNDSEGLTVYLGTNLKELEINLKLQKNTYVKDERDIWVGYLGTIGSSYDIETALKAVFVIQKENTNIKLILLGDGPLLPKYKKMAEKLNINAIFLGRKPYFEAMKILSQCDITLNPLVKGAAQSIINKVGDYAALGLPVINSLQNSEYKDLLNQYEAGINIESENVKQLADAIAYLINNPDERQSMGNNNRKLAEDKFDRSKSYQSIIKQIEEQMA